MLELMLELHPGTVFSLPHLPPYLTQQQQLLSLAKLYRDEAGGDERRTFQNELSANSVPLAPFHQKMRERISDVRLTGCFRSRPPTHPASPIHAGPYTDYNP